MFFRVSGSKRSEAGLLHSTVAQRSPNVLQFLRADRRIFRSFPRAHNGPHVYSFRVPGGGIRVLTVFQVMFLELVLILPTLLPARQIWVHCPLRHADSPDLQNHRFSRGDPFTRPGP